MADQPQAKALTNAYPFRPSQAVDPQMSDRLGHSAFSYTIWSKRVAMWKENVCE